MVGLSGGVDSSVVLWLLKQQGYRVEAVFMQNWQEEDVNGNCSIQQDLQDAAAVCDVLQVKLHVVNFSREYWQQVFQHFLDEYAAGRTPNPDILCNKEIKFKAFLQYVRSLGADLMATGHYARIGEQSEGMTLLKGIDRQKDQSYFLHLLNQEQLRQTLFPLGELTKEQVRQMARQAGLVTHDKRDSTGVCFIGERHFKEFLRGYLLARPGEIRNKAGTILGHHDGLMFHTIGQRKGLGIGGQKDQPEKPWYVVKKDVAKNRIIVSQDREDEDLSRRQLICNQVHWIAGSEPQIPLDCSAKIRYRQADEPCCLSRLDSNRWLVEFQQRQWAITPGQSVVFYQQEQCLGGGIILEEEYGS